MFYNSEIAEIDSMNITNIREIYGFIEVTMHCFYYSYNSDPL